jgi:hypothetical protein
MTDHTPDQISIKDRILTSIQSGDVTMRPKIHFTLKVAALMAVTFSVLVITVFIFNFISFSLRVSDHETLLLFGSDGLLAFLYFFPWFLLAVDLALIALLEWMVRRFRFGYSTPALYLLAGLIVSTVAAGFVIDRGTPLNDRMLEGSRHLPSPIGEFYEGAHRPHGRGSGLCRCEILSIDGNHLTLEDVRNGTTTIVVTLPLNDPRATTTLLQVGDVVFVAGREDDGEIQAFGVRRVETAHLRGGGDAFEGGL